MTDDIATLRAENARLRALLEYHDIDPHPAPPEPPLYWVPTEFEQRMHSIMAKAATGVALMRRDDMKTLNVLLGSQWDGAKIRSALSVRAPISYNVIEKS